MKKAYEKPSVETDAAFETVMAGCTFIDPNDDPGCDPDFGYIAGPS